MGLKRWRSNLGRSLHGFVTGLYIFADLIWDYFVILAAAHTYENFKWARDREIEHAGCSKPWRRANCKHSKPAAFPFFVQYASWISALMDMNRARAKEMVVKVSSLLRTAPQYGSADLITLDEELKFVEDYLGLEQMRLEGRLQLRWGIDAQARLLVPLFIPVRPAIRLR